MGTGSQVNKAVDSEEELIALLKNRDEQGFRTLVETHQQKVYNLCLGFLKNQDDADDMTQEVFIEVYHSIGRFRGEATLNTWIYRITVNKCIEGLRKLNRKKRLRWLTSIFGKQEEFENKHADFVHPGVLLENKERATILFRHIDLLPEKQKIAFNLCEIEGLSYQKVSEVMQLSISATESLMFRARKNLRKSLKGYYKRE